MSKTPIPTNLRQLVEERANGQCEYCHLSLNDPLFKGEIDHIISEKHGGLTEESNLALSCFNCNRAKGPNVATFLDQNIMEPIRLFNPQKDLWEDHFQQNEFIIEGKTKVGRATVQTLKMNDSKSLKDRVIANRPFTKQNAIARENKESKLLEQYTQKPSINEKAILDKGLEIADPTGISKPIKEEVKNEISASTSPLGNEKKQNEEQKHHHGYSH